MLQNSKPSPEMGQKMNSLEYGHPYSLVDNQGRRFIFERTIYGTATFKTGSHEVIVRNHGKLQKVFRVKTDIGYYFPMQMDIEPVFEVYAMERTVGNAWRHVRMLVKEYREFMQHMEEVAE